MFLKKSKKEKVKTMKTRRDKQMTVLTIPSMLQSAPLGKTWATVNQVNVSKHFK